MDAIDGFIDAGCIAHGPELRKNLEIFKNSEFENIKGLFSITRMVIEENSELRMSFPQMLRVRCGKIRVAE